MATNHKILLAGVSALTLAMAGPGARAAETVLPTRAGPGAVTADGSAVTADGQFSINSNATNTNPAITATARDNAAATTQSQTGAGPSSTTLGTNLIGAYATGNNQANAVPLDANSGVGAAGIAVLAVSNNAAGTSVNATATNNRFTTTATEFSAGTLANTGNTITAQTSFNQASNAVSGLVPTGLATTNPGSITFANTGTILDALGGIVVSNAQTNTTPGASAATLGVNGTPAQGNSITLAITNTAASPTINASPLLQNNTLSAIFQGNTADNAVRLASGSAFSLGGAVALTNTQQNTGFAAGTGAGNFDSQVTATIAGPTTLSGGLAVTGNTISAATTGNSAVTPATGVATGGNVISIGNLASIAPTAGQAFENTISGSTGATPGSAVAANLGLLNAQLNDGGGAASNVTTTTQNGLISATSRSANNGSVSVTANAITADTKGNQAYNAILAGGAGTTISATTLTPQVQLIAGNTGAALTTPSLIANGNTLAAIAAANSGQSALSLNGQTGTATGSVVNQQTSGTTVTAQLTNPQVSVAGTGTTVLNPTVAASGNLLRSLAYGNQATNSAGETFTTFGAAVPAGAAFTYNGSNAPTVNGGTALLNDQAANADITANAQRTATGAAVSVALANTGTLTGGTVAADTNNLVAAARANSVANTVSLASTTLNGAGAGPAVASIGNVQSVTGANVTGLASTAGNAVTVTVGNVTGTALSASNNAQTAIATGSEATNALDAFGTALQAVAANQTGTSRTTATGASRGKSSRRLRVPHKTPDHRESFLCTRGHSGRLVRGSKPIV